MSGLVPLPQTVLHSSTRLTHSQAHDLLSSFLAEAENNPALRPDSQITPHAIQSQTSGSNGNITLTHLDRILQGIAGKRVGGVEFNTGTKKRKLNNDFPSSPPVSGREQIRGEEIEDGEKEPVVTAAETGDWQDKDEFEHAQIDETGDLSGRDPADPGDDNGIEQQQVRDDMDVQSATGQGLSLAEKEARRQAKKDKQKLYKQQKNEKAKKSKG